MYSVSALLSVCASTHSVSVHIASNLLESETLNPPGELWGVEAVAMQKRATLDSVPSVV